MRRWAYLGVPIGAVVLIGGWWLADQMLAAPSPHLGPAVTVSPISPSPTPTSPAPTPPADEGPATTVAPAPPQNAGDDADESDDPDDADDD